MKQERRLQLPVVDPAWNMWLLKFLKQQKRVSLYSVIVVSDIWGN